MKTKGLGRGLASLLKEELPSAPANGLVHEVDINLVTANEEQPRKIFNEQNLKELADSILQHGVIQPIVVNEEAGGGYKIIAGERRYRACKLAGKVKIPVIIKSLSDAKVLSLALIENIQREDLTALEEAAAYQSLIDEYGYTKQSLAEIIGKSRPYVSNTLRLNLLPTPVKQKINQGLISASHARCLINLSDADEIAKKIIAKDMSVRQTEDLVRAREKQKDERQPASPSTSSSNNNADLQAIAESLSARFGVKVSLSTNRQGSGTLAFRYNSMEELDIILENIN